MPSFLLSLPEHQSRRMIRQILRLDLDARRPLFDAFGELEVILHEDVRHDRFDLVAREPSPRARMSPEAERHAGQVAGCVLRSSGHVGGLSLSNLLEPKTVILFWLWIETWVHVERHCGDSDGGVCGYDEAVGEAVVFVDYSLEGDYETRVSQLKVLQRLRYNEPRSSGFRR